MQWTEEQEFPHVNSEEELITWPPTPSVPAPSPTNKKYSARKKHCEGDIDTQTTNSPFKEQENFYPMTEVSLSCLTLQQVWANNCLVQKRLRPSDSPSPHYFCF